MTFNKKVTHILILMLIVFCGLVLYFTYFQIFKSPSLANAGNNPRTYLREQTTPRGNIYDRNGTTLAENETASDGTQKRVYPQNRLYSQLIGYSSTRYGRTLLESTFNRYLLGEADSNVLNAMLGTKYSAGASLTLTVDNELQLLAADELGENRGAIVALNPKTGEILAMLSKPWYNLNKIETDWDTLSAEDGIFVPRATNGLYPPGSSFKIITATAAVENMMEDTIYEDTGCYTVDGHEIYNYNKNVYGTLDIDKAFAKSSNTYFASLAEEIGAEKLAETAEKFCFGRDIPFDIPLKRSTLLDSHSRTNVAAVGYGQGDTLTTPLHMALCAAAIANGGVMMQPFVVSRATQTDGSSVYEAKQKVLSRAASPAAAARVGEMMKKCVSEGTGTGARLSDITVAGKTGTAEVGEDKPDHAWFVAYAPADDPQIAVCVMLENAGTTGSACAPIAARLIRKWLG